MTMGRASSLLTRLFAWTLFGFALGILIAVVAPFALGMRSLSVMSGSMEPAIHTGDVIVDDWIRPSEARVGDAVSFNDPSRRNVVLTHRVVRVVRRGGRVDFVTRGDANTGVERWSAPAHGSIGRVEFRIPHAGFLMVFTRTPGGRLLFLVIPALVWGVWELVRIWRPADEGEPDGAAA
jgi:signal peptidase I